LNLFQEECALTSAYTTPAAATPIVISCLPCVPLTSVAHGRRSPKRNMTLTKTVSAYAYQAADTRHTKLTSQAGTTRATRFYGARHGQIIQTPTLNAPEARSVSTTAATPSAALTSCPPSTWAWRLVKWRRKADRKSTRLNSSHVSISY